MNGIDDFLDEITLAIGVLLIGLALAAFRRTRRFIANCLTTEGRISGYTTEDSEEGVYYFSIVRFRGRSGVEHEIRRPHGLQEPPTIGETVSITYDPSSPTNAWITRTAAPWAIPWLVLLLGVATVVGGFVVRAESG